MAERVKLLFLLINFIVLFNLVHNSELTNMIDENIVTEKAYVFWPNATIPFFVDDAHFDKEQQLSILTALSLFAFKTCLKFAPVMARPEANEHVLVLENPSGVRKCTISTGAHSIDEPHKVILGYDCLKSPNIDMMIMKALGFPFEHNRAVRDLYIEVQFENVEPGYLDLFNRDLRLPMELRAIPYDTNSVMHFGERDFSSNGHRTIIFKNRNLRQERFGLSPLDLRKINVVYGPECLARDRQEKIELCQNYPGVARKKRDASQSLRVNPDITPPPADSDNATCEAYANKLIKDLDIEKEVQELVDQVQKVNSIALANAKTKLCSNETKKALRTLSEEPKPKLLDIIGQIASHTQDMIATATKNLTAFCSEDMNIYAYQRASCPFFDADRCEKSYKSTKSGRVKYSTQHRPLIHQSTRPQHTGKRNIHENWLRSGNNTNTTDEDAASTPVTQASKRRKRSIGSTKNIEVRATNYHGPAAVGRMGNTKLIAHPKNVYMPNYRAEKGNLRRKREAEQSDKANSAPKNDVKRRFESQRFRSKKEIVAKGEYERGKKEREWDNSGVSSERMRHRDEDQPTERHFFKLKQKQRPRSQLDSNGGRPRADEESDEPRLKKPRSRFRPVSNLKQNHEPPPEEPRQKKVDEQYPIDEGPGMGSKISQEDEKEPERGPPNRDYEPSVPERPPPVVARPPALKPRMEAQKGRWKHKDVKTTEQVVETTERVVETTERVVETRIVEKISIPSKSAMKFKSHKERGDSMSVLPRVVELSKKNREFYNERMWPDGVVRYVLKDPEGEADMADVRQRLDEVNEILKRRTCARIEEITEEEADSYEDYLVLDNSPDYVTGRVGGKQNFGVVELLKGGQHRQHAAMMVLAMLGFYFEVSRHDRDEHIRVHMRHVRPDKLHHFEKIREDATFPLPYDYKSATHPAWQFWRQLGKTGISTVATFKETDPDGSIMKSLGQNQQLLSELDIVKINSVYGIECFMKGPIRNKKKEESTEEEPKEEDPYEQYKKGSKLKKKKRRPVKQDYKEETYNTHQKKRPIENNEEDYSSPKQKKKKVKQEYIEDYREEDNSPKQKIKHEEIREDYKDYNNPKQTRHEDDKEDYQVYNPKKKVKHDSGDYREVTINVKKKVRHVTRENYREEEINNAKQKHKRPSEIRDYENKEYGREENIQQEDY